MRAQGGWDAVEDGGRGGGMKEGWWEYREKEEGGREVGGQQWEGWRRNSMFYSHPEASERRQLPADYSAVLSNN